MSIAFKEWSLICEALGSGQQSIILRKGGIAEGRDGFRFLHPEFVLFPTWFHEQLARTRLPRDTPIPEQPENLLDFKYAAAVEWTRLVRDPEILAALEAHHCWSNDVVQERFDYGKEGGIHVAMVRVYRLDPPQRVPMQKRYGGCRSWVEVPDFEGCVWVSVVSDEEHERRKSEILNLIGS